MPIPDAKKKYLKDVGLGDDEIAAVEASLAGKAKEAEAEQLESKDAPAPEAAPVEAAPEAPTPAPNAPITREEIAAAIQAALGPLATALDELQAGVKELKEAREVEVKDIAASIPAFSLVQMIQGSQQRAVGSPEAQVEKGARVKGPKETKTEAKERVVSIPFISDLLQAGGKQPEN